MVDLLNRSNDSQLVSLLILAVFGMLLWEVIFGKSQFLSIQLVMINLMMAFAFVLQALTVD